LRVNLRWKNIAVINRNRKYCQSPRRAMRPRVESLLSACYVSDKVE
jgi:hypothetical protein